jgi:hypothetical protein
MVAGPVPAAFIRTVRVGSQTFDLPAEQDEYEEALELYERQGIPVEPETVDVTQGRGGESDGEFGYDEALEELGFTPGVAVYDVRAMLEKAGVNPDHPDLQPVIEILQAELDDPDQQSNALIKVGEFTAMAVARPEYALPAVTQYGAALAESGFTEPFPAPELTPRGEKFARMRDVSREAVPGQFSRQPRFEQNDTTGWFRHRNGTLVSPDGAVVYDPLSNAPGSLAWQRSVVTQWSAKKVKEWKDRLVEFGYLSKEQAKNATVDQEFLGALGAYHQSRYIYGKATPTDAAAAGASGADRPKPVDLKDIQAEIRNNVREEYRRVYGTDPSDGEVATWAAYIMKTGMDLQRKFIREYDNPNTATAVSEATESFIEKLEGSPEAEFLRESDEENTRLRETFERMAVVTNSLAS